MAWKTWDEKLWKYVEWYSWSWSSLNPTASSKVKVEADWTKSTPTKTTTKSKDVSNIYPYTRLTWDTPAKSASRGNASDLSYMKSTNYYSSWKPWDKTIDISKDPNRAKQMAYNIKQDMITNPKLFTNRDDFNKYYEYDKSSPSQQKLLDAAFANANKYGLWATDNFYADMASQASTDKNMKKYAKDADTYNKMLPYLDDIRNKLNDRLWPVFDKLMDSQTKYLQDMAELRKLQRQYNKGMVEEANSRAAGQSASMWTMMSWQGLSQSSIASSMMWAEKTWVSELNNIQKQHIDTMKSLADAEWDFTNKWADIVWSLTSKEQWALKDWYNSFKALQDGLDNSYKTMINEQYSPYEELTWAKVSWAVDTLTSSWKSDVKQSEYQWADNWKRQRMLYNNLLSVFSWSPETMAKLSTYISSAAAQYSDFQTALTSILTKAGANSSDTKKIVNKIISQWWQEGKQEDEQYNNEDPLANYDFSWINLWIWWNNSNNNINLWI